MKKYKITLSGKGSETFVFPIDESQKKKLKDLNIENFCKDYDEISTILNCEYLSDCLNTFLGVYADPELFTITVEDNNNNIIWESSQEFYPEDNNEEFLYEDSDVLLIEDYCKGNFFTYELELKDDFNPDLISFNIKEISERIQLITGLTYNKEDIEDYKDFGDNWSKGLNYYLCEK
jgi:hypothetical protein